MAPGEKKMTNWQAFKEELLKDPAVRREYETSQPEYDEIVASVRRGLSDAKEGKVSEINLKKL